MERILIIGAGLTGAALTFHLARAGAKVTVLEAALQPASQASGRSFGWINASFYLTEAHHRLRAQGIAAHHRLARNLGSEVWDWPGCLWWEEAAGLDAMAAALAAWGYEAREVSRAEMARLEPALSLPPDRALLFPQQGAVDATALTRALLSAAARFGAELLFGMSATGLVGQGGAIMGAQAASGVIAADQVMLAAGTGAQALLAGLRYNLPKLSRPGMIMTTQPVARGLNHILATPEGDLRQDAAGRLIAPLAAHHQSDVAETSPTDPQALAAAALIRLN